MRGLIVPQGHNNPPTIIPLTHSRASRESGDYASSDVQVSPPTTNNDPDSHHARHFVNIVVLRREFPRLLGLSGYIVRPALHRLAGVVTASDVTLTFDSGFPGAAKIAVARDR